MPIETALLALQRAPRFRANVAAWTVIPGQEARFAPFPEGLDARLTDALSGRGIDQLYTHQAEAVGAALRREHVVVVSPAASGKTLCYNLPALDRLLREPQARALYLFPTKALAQDQLVELRTLAGALAAEQSPDASRNQVAPAHPARLQLSISCATYDGDTPSSQRPQIRDAARIVLSNPDMLHAGILPQHTRWAAFFSNLRVVVLDEMHAYRGVFGSHVANVLRRLRRICHFYGSDPQFFLASATIANPASLAAQLVEAPVTLIGPEKNGAPQGAKQILFYNPPLLDAALGIRRSSSLESADLAAHFLSHDVQTIVFAPARLTAELTLTYLRALAGAAGRGASAASIHGYRAGYLPSERREIERGLRNGNVRCVVATNALELGIDIGQLELAVLIGYPGSIASMRQQMGRAGRRQGDSAAILVATPAAVDQYIVRHPQYVLGGSNEHALINPDNDVILAGHLACAAAELPIDQGEAFGQAIAVGDLLGELVEAGQLYQAGQRFFWAGAGYPATSLSLRSSSPDRVAIQASRAGGKPEVIGELDRFSVPLLLYEGAIYMHEGVSYIVERLDWDDGIAFVRPSDVEFYTKPIIGERVEIVRERGESESPPPERAASTPAYDTGWGDVRVVSQATGYRMLRLTTHEMLGYGTIDLPEQVLETQGCWLALRRDVIDELKAEGQWLSDPNDYGPEWVTARNAARARDKYRCQSCGTPEIGGRQHDVHHKIPLRAFLSDPSLRGGLPADKAWVIGNRLDNLVTLCPACHRQAEASVRIRTGMGGVAALLVGVAPILLMCDSRDLGMTVEPQAAGSGLPMITIYERVPGGVGYARQMYDTMGELLAAAYDLVTQCPCERGCPSCVGPAAEHEYAPDSKALSAAILEKCLAELASD